MIINGQADVLRSEGEAFGEKLRCAGVEVTALCVQGTIHDFVIMIKNVRISVLYVIGDCNNRQRKMKYLA